MLSRRLFTLSLLAASTPSTPLWAKPQRMRIVVPYPAGGPLDAAARITAESIKSRYGRVIVENRAGAAGARAMLEVKNAASDGMTLAVGALATLVVNPLRLFCRLFIKRRAQCSCHEPQNHATPGCS